jgi:hypothetical protein
MRERHEKRKVVRKKDRKRNRNVVKEKGHERKSLREKNSARRV